MRGTAEVLRTEKKYSITPEAVCGLVDSLSLSLKQDPHNVPGGYMVRSLYFDTPYDDDYADKLDGIEHRRKIRLRVYSPDAPFAKLEIKEKTGPLQRKRSISVSQAQAKEIIAGNYSCLLSIDHELAHELYRTLTLKAYRPVVTVEYLRTAYIVDANDTRVTIDQMLSSSEANFNIFSDKLITSPVSDYPIMEVKYNGFLLDSVKTLVNITGENETANSKYVMARIYRQ